jgi:hypothetical protein
MNPLDVVTGLVKPIGDYFTRRSELKAAERQQQAAIQAAKVERQIELIKAGQTADMNWEMEFAKQASSSWKDEYTLLIVSIPAILCFVKTKSFDGPAIVKAGMEALSNTPLWYQIMFGSIFLATYGIRYWRRTQYDTE